MGARFEVYPERREQHRFAGLVARRERPIQWRWRLVAANGEIVAVGEAYTSRGDALRGALDARAAATAAHAIIDGPRPRS